MTTALDELTASGLRPLVDDLRARAVPAEQATAEVEWVWWSSLAEEIALRDPRVAAHDGRALTRSVGEFAEADRAVVEANAERVLAAVADHVAEVVARPPGAGDVPAGRGRARPAAGPAARPRDALPRPGHGGAAVLGDEPARRRLGAAAGAVVRRRRLRRGLAGAAGRGGLGDLARPPGRRRRRLAPAAARPRSSPPSPTATPPRSAPTRRSPRGSSRSSTCSPPRCRAAGCRGTTARSTSGSSRSPTPRSTRGRSSPSRAPAPTRSCTTCSSRAHGMVAEGEGAVETTTTEVDRVVELVLEHARTRPDRSLGVIALGIAHATRVEEALRRALAGARRRGARVLRRGPARAVLRQEPRAGAGRRARRHHPHRRLRQDPARAGAAPVRAAQHRGWRASAQRRDHPGPALDDRGVVDRGRRPRPGPAARPRRDDAARLPRLRGRRAAARGACGRCGRAAGCRARRRSPVPARSCWPTSRGGCAPTGSSCTRTSAPRPTRSTWPSRTRAHRARLVLAVESDGPQYAAMRTTRDRDRLRAEQLERLGWRHLRVWSTDVFRDPARDVSRILEAAGVREAPGDDWQAPDQPERGRASRAAGRPTRAACAAGPSGPGRTRRPTTRPDVVAPADEGRRRGRPSTTAGCASSAPRTGSDAAAWRQSGVPTVDAPNGPPHAGARRGLRPCVARQARGARSSSRISLSSSVLGSIVSASGSAGKSFSLAFS